MGNFMKNKLLLLAVCALGLVGNSLAMEAEKPETSYWYLTYLSFSDQLKKIDGTVHPHKSVVQIYDADSYESVATLQQITNGGKATQSSKYLSLEFLPSSKSRPLAQTVTLNDHGRRICCLQINGQKKSLKSYNQHGLPQLLFKSKGELTFKGRLLLNYTFDRPEEQE